MRSGGCCSGCMRMKGPRQNPAGMGSPDETGLFPIGADPAGRRNEQPTHTRPCTGKSPARFGIHVGCGTHMACPAKWSYAPGGLVGSSQYEQRDDVDDRARKGFVMVEMAALWLVGMTVNALAQGPATPEAASPPVAPQAAQSPAPPTEAPPTPPADPTATTQPADPTAPITAPAEPNAQPAGAPAKKPLLWVAPVALYGLPADLTPTLNDAVLTEAAMDPGHMVLGEADIDKLLTLEQRKQVLGCSDPACMTDLGRAVNADHILACTVSGMGEDAQVGCRLLGVKETALLASKERKVAPKPAALTETLRALVGLLLTGQVRERKGLVELRVTQPGAKVLLDGREIGVSPIREPIRIDEGKREIVVSKGGYSTWRTTVDVQAGSFTAVDVKLSATRALHLWPLGVVSFLGTALALGPGMLLGVGTGAVADCYYWGRINPYDLPNKLPNDPLNAPLSRTSDVCHRLPASNPAYKERPIDSYASADRKNQVMASAIAANVLYGGAAVIAAITLTAGVALLVTDLIIKVIRREE